MAPRIYFLILLAFISCKKESNNQKPIIEITVPKENASFSVLGSIDVNATIQDDGIIESVSISLYDINSKQDILKPKYFYPNSNSYQLDTKYIISDSLIYSGDYYLAITAKDNETQTTAYRAIKIKGIAKKIISTIVATSDGTNTFIYEFGFGSSPQNIAKFDRPCKKILIDNYYQTLWYLPETGNSLIAYDLIDQQIKFEYNHLASSNSNIYTDMSLRNDVLYVSTKSGHIKGFSYNFMENFIYQSTVGRIPKRIFENQDLLIVSESNLANQNEQISTIYKVSGAPKSSLSYTKELIGFKARNLKDSYLIMVEDSSFYFYDYDLDLGFSSLLYSFQGGVFFEAIAIDNQEFLMVGDKKLARFNLNTNYFLELQSNLENAKVVYDEVNGLAYVSNGKELRIVNVQTGATINTVYFQESISALAIRYNR